MFLSSSIGSDSGHLIMFLLNLESMSFFEWCLILVEYEGHKLSGAFTVVAVLTDCEDDVIVNTVNTGSEYCF